MLPLILATITNEKTKHKAEVLYKKYIGLMIHIAREMVSDHTLADDIVSEAAIKLIRNVEKIASLGCYQQKQYIVLIIKNTCIDHYRKVNKRKNETAGDWDTDNMAIDEINRDPLEDIINKEGYEAIVNAIMELPDTLKDVTYLYLVHGHDHDEIADILGISYDNSKMRLSRAKKIVQKILNSRLAGE